MNGDTCAFSRTLNHDAAYRCVFEFLLQEITYFNISLQHGCEILAVRKPLGRPVLFSARRKPRGSIFCPMIYPLVAHKQRDVAGLLFNAVTTAFCACREALQARALVHIHRSNFQSIDVCAFIVLGVGNSRLQHFFSNSALFFGENVRMFNACSTDLPRIRSATRRAFVQTRGHFSKQRKLSSRHLNVSPSYRPRGL